MNDFDQTDEQFAAYLRHIADSIADIPVNANRTVTMPRSSAILLAGDLYRAATRLAWRETENGAPLSSAGKAE